jgi:N utilization substance protein A
MAISPLMAALNQLCDEKGLSKDTVLEVVEAALAAAYRKDYGKPHQIIRAHLDQETGEISMKQILEVAKDVEDENSQITVKQAKKYIKYIKNKKYKKNPQVGDEIELPLPAPDQGFGRIAAQTAKQVITQKIQEAEREIILKEFEGKEGQIITGTIQQMERDNYIVNLGKANGILPRMGQVAGDNYSPSQRMKFYLEKVEQSNRGPRLLLSRSHPEFVVALFSSEVPEIPAGTVEIKGIAREAGVRSKMAVATSEKSLDPVGSCVGQRGTRVQAVLSELGDEKIDIILWNEKTEKLIENALSPAKITKVKIDKKKKEAKVMAPEDQLSLAIGKNGQNVRLASKLTGFNIDIEKTKEKGKKESKTAKGKTQEKPTKELKDKEAKSETK